MKKITQADKVWEWLEKNKTISEYEARMELGIWRLSDVILKLRKKIRRNELTPGYRIVTEDGKVTRPDGTKTGIGRYRLVKLQWREHIYRRQEGPGINQDLVSIDMVADCLGIERLRARMFASDGDGIKIMGSEYKDICMTRNDAGALEHDLKYSKLAGKAGVKWTEDDCRFVNETLESMREKFKQDRHMNNIPLRLWDNLAAGIMAYNLTGIPLSLSDGVCMSKWAARDLLKRTEKKEEEDPPF